MANFSERTARSRFAKATSVFFAVLVFAFGLLAAAPAQAKEALRGVALIIGNGDYEAISALPNPENDAKAVELLLDDLGFETYLSLDRDARRLRRDLEDFFLDAADADVALFYYAGHGIEAGGENYLVPIDADVSDSSNLVPLNGFLSELQATVPVAVVLLDACRTNPFPAEFRVSLPGQAQPVGVSTMGLAPPQTRGSFSMDADAAPRVENLVTLVGFAAEPGRAALDGNPGGNSPYATAILRHLGATADTSFSTVMNLIGEEVYLATAGQQRPWVSQSLRRQLYFGGLPRQTDDDDALVTDERRALLVHIAQFSTDQRVSVEQVAMAQNVPMALVYAVLRAAEVAPDAPQSEIDRVLAARLTEFSALQSRAALFSDPDPEILRLTRLADEAEMQGALNAAGRFRELAKQRVADLEDALDDQIETLIERHREHAATYANSARTKVLQGDFLAAADDYQAAYDTIKRWDAELAFDYRRYQLRELVKAQEIMGFDVAQQRLQAAALSEIERPTVVWSPIQKALFHRYLGHASGMAFRQTGSSADFEKAASHYRETMRLVGDAQDREAGIVRYDLAGLLFLRGQQDGDRGYLDAAVDMLGEARDFVDPGAELETLLFRYNTVARRDGVDDPEAQAILREITAILSRPGGAQKFSDLARLVSLNAALLSNLGRFTGAVHLEDDAIEAYALAVRLQTVDENPMGVATSLSNRGNLYVRRAHRGVDGAARNAFQDYVAALEAISAETHPSDYASIYDALRSLIFDFPDAFSETELKQVVAFGNAWRSDSANLSLEAQYSSFENSMARLYIHHGRETGTAASFQTAIEWLTTYADLAEPGSYGAATAAYNTGLALYDLAELRSDAEAFRDASNNFATAAAIYAALNDPVEAFDAWYDQAKALYSLAHITNTVEDFQRATNAYQRALNAVTDDVAPVDLAHLHTDLGFALNELGLLQSDARLLLQGVQSFQQSAAYFDGLDLVNDALVARYQAARVTHDAAFVTDDIEAYAQALSDYEAVLVSPGTLSRELQFDIQLNMGFALMDLAALTGTADVYAQAQSRFENALAVATLEGLDAAEALPDRIENELSARFHLGETLYFRGEGPPADAALLMRAAEEFELVGRASAGDTEQRLLALNTGAYAIILAHRAVPQGDAIDLAVEMAEDALRIATETRDGIHMPYIEGTLCDALTERALLHQRRSDAERAFVLCQSSLAAFRAMDDAAILEIAEDSMRRVQSALDSVRP